MHRLTSFVLLLAAIWAPAAAAQTPAAGGADAVRAQLEQLVAGHRYDRAEQAVERSVSAGAPAAPAYFQLGSIYFEHDEWQRSARLLAKCLKADPANDQAHQLLGLDWRALHRPEDAEAELLEAARINPSNRVNAYFAGHQLLLNGKFEAALPYLYAALQSAPLQPQALAAVALAQARLGNYGLAESYYRKALDAPGASADARYSALANLSILLMLEHEPERLEEALARARQAVQLRPASPDAHYLAGKALFKLGRFDEAVPELAQAAKLRPDDSKPHYLLARIYDQLGRHDRARQERELVARGRARAGQAGMSSADPMPGLPE